MRESSLVRLPSGHHPRKIFQTCPTRRRPWGRPRTWRNQTVAQGWLKGSNWEQWRRQLGRQVILWISAQTAAPAVRSRMDWFVKICVSVGCLMHIRTYYTKHYSIISTLQVWNNSCFLIFRKLIRHLIYQHTKINSESIEWTAVSARLVLVKCSTRAPGPGVLHWLMRPARQPNGGFGSPPKQREASADAPFKTKQPGNYFHSCVLRPFENSFKTKQQTMCFVWLLEYITRT